MIDPLAINVLNFKRYNVVKPFEHPPEFEIFIKYERRDISKSINFQKDFLNSQKYRKDL